MATVAETVEASVAMEERVREQAAAEAAAMDTAALESELRRVTRRVSDCRLNPSLLRDVPMEEWALTRARLEKYTLEWKRRRDTGDPGPAPAPAPEPTPVKVAAPALIAALVSPTIPPPTPKAELEKKSVGELREVHDNAVEVAVSPVTPPVVKAVAAQEAVAVEQELAQRGAPVPIREAVSTVSSTEPVTVTQPVPVPAPIAQPQGVNLMPVALGLGGGYLIGKTKGAVVGGILGYLLGRR